MERLDAYRAGVGLLPRRVLIADGELVSKLVDALRIVGRPAPEGGSHFGVSLVCGFTPLHLETFLAAGLRQALPQSRVEVSTGVFDDLLGNLQRAGQSDVDAVAVVVEWADIDARLGLRRLGGWDLADVSDIVEQAELFVARLGHELAEVAESKPVICCLPTLPLPPLFPQRPEESSTHELQLRESVASLRVQLSAHEGIRVCSSQFLADISPAERRDVKSELNTGFPYSIEHASNLGETLATLIRNPVPKKALITDLDDTLWSGLLGEVGPSDVSWDLDSRSQAHGLYQQLLSSLATAGVLIAVASKNDPHVVEEAFERADLLLSKDSIFPFEVHWGPKSTSVQRILEAWNIAPDAIVMVDDSPMEIAQVQEVFPDIEGVRFPAGDGDVWEFLFRLRSLFGKPRATSEDALRLASLRSSAEFRQSAAGSTYSPDDFLARAEGTVEFSSDPQDKARALELLNKTNQFNLNGARLTEAAFNEALSAGGASLVTASYEDKFGPLGTIAALIVRPNGPTLAIDSWVMSCRAFSRRVEHHCLQYLFEKFGVEEIAADYRATERNGPLTEFLTSVLGAAPNGNVRLTRPAFDERAPRLVHHVSEAAR